MFGPYRTAPEPKPPERRTRTHEEHEELVLAWALLVIGGVRIVFVLASHEIWGTEPTLAMLLAMGGFAMLAQR